MPLIALGLSHRNASLEDLAEFTRAGIGLADRLYWDSDAGIEGAVVLATCNRFEVFVDAPNFHPAKALGMTTDPLLAQSAIDRLTSGAHTLIIEGPSYRQRGRVTIDTTSEAHHAH